MSDTPLDLGVDTHIVDEGGHPAPPDRAAIRKFALPSLLGIATFLTPVKVDGNWTILMGLISDTGRDLVGARTGMPCVFLVFFFFSAVGTVYAKTLF